MFERHRKQTTAPVLLIKLLKSSRILLNAGETIYDKKIKWISLWCGKSLREVEYSGRLDKIVTPEAIQKFHDMVGGSGIESSQNHGGHWNIA